MGHATLVPNCKERIRSADTDSECHFLVREEERQIDPSFVTMTSTFFLRVVVKWIIHTCDVCPVLRMGRSQTLCFVRVKKQERQQKHRIRDVDRVRRVLFRFDNHVNEGIVRVSY